MSWDQSVESSRSQASPFRSPGWNAQLAKRRLESTPALRRILWNHNLYHRNHVFCILHLLNQEYTSPSLSGTEFHSRTKSSDKVDGMGWCKGFSCKPCTPRYLKSLIPLESAGCICFQITWDLSNFVDDILGCGKFTNPPLKKSR